MLARFQKKYSEAIAVLRYVLRCNNFIQSTVKQALGLLSIAFYY
jgi:hypothetical protein